MYVLTELRYALTRQLKEKEKNVVLKMLLEKREKQKLDNK